MVDNRPREGPVSALDVGWACPLWGYGAVIEAVGTDGRFVRIVAVGLPLVRGKLRDWITE